MDRFLIVGLGNPGREYAGSRHNIGFHCIDALAHTHGLTFTRLQHKALITDGRIAGQRAVLAKPQTFMNRSGQSVGALMRFYKLPIENLIVVHDDLDLPLGTLRLRKQGGAGGQRGMRDIINHLGTNTFARVRFGIGRPPGRMDPAAYVLQQFDGDELPEVEAVTRRVVCALETWLRDGIDIAMTQHNGTGQPPATEAPPASNGTDTNGAA